MVTPCFAIFVKSLVCVGAMSKNVMFISHLRRFEQAVVLREDTFLMSDS